MKKVLLGLVLAATAIFASAATVPPLEFNIVPTEQGAIVDVDLSKMTYIGETDKWLLYAHIEPFSDTRHLKILHSLTQFRTEQRTDIRQVSFDKIYSYGFIDCRSKELNIFNEWYTKNNDIIMLRNNFEPGEFPVDLGRNIILETLYILACRVESV